MKRLLLAIILLYQFITCEAFGAGQTIYGTMTASSEVIRSWSTIESSLQTNYNSTNRLLYNNGSKVMVTSNITTDGTNINTTGVITAGAITTTGTTSAFVLKAGDTMTGTLTLSATSGLSTASKDAHIRYYDDRGYANDVGILTTHWAEMTRNTLLDRSRSSLTATGGVLTYHLYAMDGSGGWNFNGVPLNLTTTEASVALTKGNNTIPQINFIYFDLVGVTPELKTSATEPTGNTIMVAEFLVGSVEGTTYTIYGYNRARDELDTFVNRVIDRVETSGTLYKSGFVPTVVTTMCSIGGGYFYNGIFEMYTTAEVTSQSFTSITGNTFEARTNITDIVKYCDGNDIGTNKYFNVVWGIVPTSTTSSGAVATVPRLYAVKQNKPITEYISAAQAIDDAENKINYFPNNDEFKEIFVPVIRTVMKKGGQFQSWGSGLYYQDIRGKVMSGGGAASAIDLSGYVKKSGDTMTGGLSITGNVTVDAGSAFYIGTSKVVGPSGGTGPTGPSGATGSTGPTFSGGILTTLTTMAAVDFHVNSTGSGTTRTVRISGYRTSAGTEPSILSFWNTDSITYEGARISLFNTDGSDDGELKIQTNDSAGGAVALRLTIADDAITSAVPVKLDHLGESTGSHGVVVDNIITALAIPIYKDYGLSTSTGTTITANQLYICTGVVSCAANSDTTITGLPYTDSDHYVGFAQESRSFQHGYGVAAIGQWQNSIEATKGIVHNQGDTAAQLNWFTIGY